MFSANQFELQLIVYYSDSSESHHFFFLMYVAFGLQLLHLKRIIMSVFNLH